MLRAVVMKLRELMALLVATASLTYSASYLQYLVLTVPRTYSASYL
jgi:hypothetical protein